MEQDLAVDGAENDELCLQHFDLPNEKANASDSDGGERIWNDGTSGAVVSRKAIGAAAMIDFLFIFATKRFLLFIIIIIYLVSLKK